MNIKKIIIGSTLSFLLGNGITVANSAGDVNIDKAIIRFSEIFQIVGPSDGYINKDIHDSLWKMLSEDASLNLGVPAEVQNFKRLLDKEIGYSMYFPYVTWDSARRTLETNQITYHPDYKKYRKIMLNKGYVTAANNGDKVIQSALDGTPIENTQGMRYITETLVDDILTNFEVSKERLSILLTYPWNPKAKERSLKLAHIKTISAFPYAFVKTKDNGMTFYSYTSQFTQWSFKSIIWMPIDNLSRVLSKAELRNMTKDILKFWGVNSSDILVNTTKWNGLSANRGSGVGYGNNKKVNFSVATISRPDLGGLLMFTGGSENSQLEANRYIEELLTQTKLDH